MQLVSVIVEQVSVHVCLMLLDVTVASVLQIIGGLLADLAVNHVHVTLRVQPHQDVMR